jgi:hypothetical protein
VLQTGRVRLPLFRSRSTGYPLVSDKKSTDFCTGQRSVIPSEIRGFSARFATAFQHLFPQLCAFSFHQLFHLISSGSEADSAGERKGEKKAESEICGKVWERQLGPLLMGVSGGSAHTMWHVEQFTGCAR